jgi:DNA-binding NtrC family response regulator
MAKQIGDSVLPHGGYILLVDDDRAQAEMYRLRLARAGYQVRTTVSAADALQTVCTDRPNLVVLDMHMPERDGLSVLQELLDLDPSLPVIIHTAYPGYADNFLTWAAEAYVIKSQDVVPLMRAIEDSLAGPRRRSA